MCVFFFLQESRGFQLWHRTASELRNLKVPDEPLVCVQIRKAVYPIWDLCRYLQHQENPKKFFYRIGLKINPKFTEDKSKDFIKLINCYRGFQKKKMNDFKM